MKYGLFGINNGLCATDPRAGGRIAAEAEKVGWESLWAGEHYVLPEPELWSEQSADEVTDDALLRRQSGSNAMDPRYPILDVFTALSYVAAHTSTIRLGTGVVVLPVHQPVMLAKKVASLAKVSGDRFVFGVGAGYLEPEFTALGVPLAGRGKRADEALEVLNALWTDQTVTSHHGQHFDVGGVHAYPHPDRPVPIVMGGHSDAALRRAIRFAVGWFGWDLTPELAAPLVQRLREFAEQAGHREPFEITVNPVHETPMTPDLVAQYEAAGVDRLAVLAPLSVRVGDEAGYLEWVRTAIPS